MPYLKKVSEVPRYMANQSVVVKLANGDRRVVRVGRVYDPDKEPVIERIVAQYPQFFDHLEPVAGTETADSSKRDVEIPWPDDNDFKDDD